MWRSLVVVSALLVGCGGDSAPMDRDGDLGDGGMAPDYFDPDRVLDIEIEMDPADWDLLRSQARTLVDIFGGEDCLAEPFARPFTWFEGTVTVEGVTLERVGVRKKGFFGSLSDEKPSLKLEFDEFVADQLLFGTERMTFNNAQQDPSYINQCIGYQLFAEAGVPTPRCNFAHVTVNGQDLGLYVHVESAKKRLLRRFFDDDEGNFYEGTLSDFRDGWTSTFEQQTNRVTNPSDFADIAEATAAMSVDDAEFIARQTELFDLDAFYTFWAMEVIIGHWDGYTANTNNYYLYHDPSSDRFAFVPWGIDAILRDENPFGLDAGATPVFFQGVLPQRLYQIEESRAAYIARARELLATLWDEAALDREIDRMVTLIRPYLQARDQTEERNFERAVEHAREFVAERRTRLEAALDAPPIDVPSLREPFCLSEFEGSFDTTWGTLGTAEPLGGGTGTANYTQGTESRTYVGIGSLAGGADATRAIVAIFALRQDGIVDVFLFVVPRDQVRSGATIALGSNVAFAGVQEILPGVEEWQDRAFFLEGTITFERAGIGPDEPIVGTVEGLVIGVR